MFDRSKTIAATDPQLWQAIQQEDARQESHIELIASENYTSPAVMAARVLQYIREHGRITNRDFQTLVPNVSPETLRMDLADLVEKGVMMRIGEKKGTYYILK